MKIFLSHSGKKSFTIAKLFKKWLPEVIQAVEPWLSEDIPKGDRWRERLNQALNESNIGIICLTKENAISPWILFESGSLSRDIDANLCTFLIDLEPGDIKGPLESFQHTIFSKEDVLKLLYTINAKLALPLVETRLEKAFNRLWPEFEKDLNEILKKNPIEDNRSVLISPTTHKFLPKKTEDDAFEKLFPPGVMITADMSIIEKIDKIQAQENWMIIIESNTNDEIKRGIEKDYPEEYINQKKNLLDTIHAAKKRISEKRESLGL
jgi:hypothetical protein